MGWLNLNRTGSIGGPIPREEGPDAPTQQVLPGLRERAVRMVFDHAPEHSSQWAAIRSVAEKLGCTVEALRRWVRQAERDTGKRSGLTTDKRRRLKQLARENVELKRANEACRP
jgi:transposase